MNNMNYRGVSGTIKFDKKRQRWCGSLLVDKFSTGYTGRTPEALEKEFQTHVNQYLIRFRADMRQQSAEAHGHTAPKFIHLEGESDAT